MSRLDTSRSSICPGRRESRYCRKGKDARVTASVLSDRTTVAAGAVPLEALAAARERLIRAEVALRSEGIARVASGVDCRGYQTGPTFEMYIEAELAAGYTLTWWLDVTWDRAWSVAARLLRDDDAGQTVERQ